MPHHRSAMTIEVLYFDGCPNHDAVFQRLRRLLDEAGVRADVGLRRIESDEEAQRLRFLGSPSVRVDGRDVEPGAHEREDFGLKCRLYRTPEGLTGAPPDAWIRAAVGAGSRADAGRSLAASLATQRSARDRLADCPPAYRRLHRRVLRAFVAGERPGADDLARWAHQLEIEPDDAVDALARHDVVWLDPETRLVATAYPFSGAPTPHRVSLPDSGVEVFAMCAIDALGIPFMASRPAHINSRDAIDSGPIELWLDPAGERRSEPPGVAVTIGVSGDGPSASCCCPHINFVADPARAGAPVLELDAAIEVGRQIFGSLLHRSSAAR
jgi:hypothetical protein